MFNDVFWFSMSVAAIGSTALAAVGIAFPAAPCLDRPPGFGRARLRRARILPDRRDVPRRRVALGHPGLGADVIR